MSHPWDLPPLPDRGDADDDTTYLAVGQAMSYWEAVEVQLARLSSVFQGQPDALTALHQYGQPRIFRERLSTLNHLARAHFTQQPNQHLEGTYCSLVLQLEGFADRRNDAAHGVVEQIQQLRHLAPHLSPDTAGTRQYALIPALYTVRRYQQTGTPDYAFTSLYLTRLAEHLLNLRIEIENFDEAVRRQLGMD